MDSIFKICKDGQFGLIITGLEKDNDEYLSDEELIVSTRNYSYLQTITLNVITSIQSSGDELMQSYDIVKHTIDCIDESNIKLQKDGLYQVTHIILPTNDWLQYVLERDKESLSAYNYIYYYDNDSDTFMKYTKDNSIKVDITEILEINSSSSNVTTIIRGDKNTFCMGYINQCFYQICKQILTTIPKCTNKLDILQIHNRDILWMTINVIKYLIDLGQYYEAQRILENVMSCNNLCKVSSNNSNSSGCGCT